MFQSPDGGIMSASGPGSVVSFRGTAASDRLDSWKEIAAHLRRDESTVRRWEKNGLPVHRHLHKSRAAVFAYRSELDAWWTQESPPPESAPLVVVSAPALASTRRSAAPRRMLAAGGAIAVVLLSFALVRVLSASHRTSGASAMTLTPFMDTEGELSYPAFSPDGRQLAFSWVSPERPVMQIYVKLIGSETPLRLTHTDRAENFAATWSPDAEQVAFLRRSDSEAGIFVTSASGGGERRILALRPDRYFALDWSPDGRAIAFARRESADDPYSIFLLSMEDGQQRQVTFPPTGAYGDLHFALSPDGSSLAFIRHGEPTLRDMTIEIVRLDSAGKPKMVASYREWIGNLAWSADSRSLIVTGQKQGVRRLWRLGVDDGREEPLAEAEHDAYFPVVARAGGRLAFVRENEDTDLWRAELTTPQRPAGKAARVIFSTRVEGAPRFSPDGKRIAFMSYRSGTPELWISDPYGGNAVQLTSFQTRKPELPSWSPDGQLIAFAGGAGFHTIRATGGKPQSVFGTSIVFVNPSWSCDGRWIYYGTQGDGGVGEVWRVPVAGGTPIKMIRNALSAIESADGAFLYFTKGDAPGIWRVPVNGGEAVLVVSGQRPEYPGYWSVFGDGLYFLDAGAAAIDFFDFATGRSTPVLTLSGAADPWRGGLTVSPDRRSIVFSQRQYSSSEIVLAENFR